jgi:alanine racemase
MAFITLSRQAFFHNLDIIASKTGDTDKIALVLKDNAYGHGLMEMAQMAHEYGITRAVVRHLNEARQIESLFKDIVMLDGVIDTPSAMISTTLNTLEMIPNIPQGSVVELKVDTGMHRNGIAIEALEKAFDLMAQHKLTCKGIFTHYRSADALSSEFFWQRKNFEAVKTKARTLGFKGRFHSCNSAGLFRHEHFDEDIVRVGIAAYGCLELDAVFEPPHLKPVLSLWAKRGASRLLKAQQHVGYNATGKVDTDTNISTYNVGYADGLFRLASNRYVLPNGAKILGRISMDNCTLTCNDDEVLIFNNANDFARAADTIGYEVLAALKPNISRTIV